MATTPRRTRTDGDSAVVTIASIEADGSPREASLAVKEAHTWASLRIGAGLPVAAAAH